MLSILIKTYTDNWIVKLGLSVLTLLSPISYLLHAILVFVLIDLISGCYASYKNGEKITSNKLRNTVTKMIVYLTSIMMCFYFQKLFIPEIEVAKIMTGFLITTEIFSTFENFTRITKVNFVEIFKQILEKTIYKNNIKKDNE